MQTLKFHTASALRALYDLAKGVCEEVYVEERPLATPEQMKEFIVIGLPVGLKNHGPYQTGIARFEIFVRNKAKSQPNVIRLDALLNKLVALFPMENERILMKDPYLALKGQDNVGFSIWNVQCEVLVNTSDRYDGEV